MNDPRAPKISILIVNYNSGARLARCLECLGRQTFDDFEIIIVDNGSRDASMSAAAANDRTQIIEAGENLGFAVANNRAAKLAQGEWLALLNPDAYPHDDWLEQLITATKRYSDVDAFGSTQLNADDPSVLDGAGDVFHAFGVPYRGYFGWPTNYLPEDGECFSPCAAAALYRRTAFAALGGFDESFFCYVEDVDFGFRLRLAGGRAIQVKDARVLHEGSGISGRHSEFSVYHGHRNRIWCAYKNLPGLLFWGLLPLHLFVSLLLLTRLTAIGAGAAGFRGMIDGYSRLAKMGPARRAVHRTRKVKLGDIARAMTWSPTKLLRRTGDIRPISRKDA